jgi:hypothetical protein
LIISFSLFNSFESGTHLLLACQFFLFIRSFHHSFYFQTTDKMKSTTLAVLFFSAIVSASPARAPLRTRQANAQTFTGNLGGVAATPVEDSGNAARPFSVKGDTFVNLAAALQRSCDQQFNGCANLANGGQADFSVADCTAQKGEYDLNC